MPCYFPIRGLYNSRTRKMYFGSVKGDEFVKDFKYIEEMSVPCGRCIGCRLEYSRKWAIRCLHEASLHKENCFITLTYDDNNLPPNKSLVKRDLQLFMKRLRKKYGEGIRFFAAGEYGDQTLRPHYHLILFGFVPPDYKPARADLQLDPFAKNVDWSKICKMDFASMSQSFGQLPFSDSISSLSSAVFSSQLADIWKKGHVTCGDVTFESCAYVARYCMKKISGPSAEEHYNGREREFVLMSRNPGIGKAWIDKYMNETYDNDSVVSRGHKVIPPRFYDNQLEKVNPFKLEELKLKRREFAKEKAKTLTRERLEVMNLVTTERQKKHVKKI